jgi:GTP cyclohydrolase I
MNPHHQENIRDLIGSVLDWVGDPDREREGLKDTPARVAKSFGELYAGYDQDPVKVLERTFPADGYDQVVVLSGIEFFSTCEHHMLPFYGQAHVAYLPGKRIVGLSKLARLVDCYSRRLQVQERLTEQVANALEAVLEPRGVAVVFEGVHTCMVARGVQKRGATMKTCSLRGTFLNQPAARAEVFSLFNMGDRR